MTRRTTSAVGDPDRGSVVVLTSLSLVVLVGMAGLIEHSSRRRILTPVLLFALAWPTLLANGK